MAIDDLETLRQELPEVFESHPLAADWDEEWIIAPIDNPGSALSSPLEEIVSVNEPESMLDQWPVAGMPPVTGTFPGSPALWPWTSPYPPPDALAFYLPFHYYFPAWWGVYLTVEGISSLATFIWHHMHGSITLKEAYVVSRLFLYGHEAYHHAVESFATRLEVTHRSPLYRQGFEALYRKTIGTDDAHEEALANAKAYKLAADVARKMFKGRPTQQQGVRAALSDYIQGCPPGYRRGVEVAKRFKENERAFAENNHWEALPSSPRKNPEVWATFSYAIAGIARRVSRVNYIIHRSSSLAHRLPAHLRYLAYKDLVRKLKDLAQITFDRHGKGSHEIWRTPSGKNVVIPRHPGDLRKGTLSAIIKQAGLKMSVDDFVRG